MNRQSVLAISALLAAAPFGMAAMAAPVEESDSVGVKTMTVHYDAAAITDSKSAEKLFFRIRAAAEEVCRLASYPHGYEIWDEHSCAGEAVAEAVREADLPALDQYYNRGSGSAAITRG
jgi:UrcA family protein